MRVSLYDKSYEKSYLNNIGPGPAAYSQLYLQRMTDKFKQSAFTRSNRKLTQASTGPGPGFYQEHHSKEMQTLKV